MVKAVLLIEPHPSDDPALQHQMTLATWRAVLTEEGEHLNRAWSGLSLEVGLEAPIAQDHLIRRDPCQHISNKTYVSQIGIKIKKAEPLAKVK